MNNIFSLTGKTFLVTGASSGIGFETCKTIHSLGGKVIAIARNEENLKDLIKQLNPDEDNFIKADLSDKNDIKLITEQITNIDGIVHSAGVVTLSPLKFINEEKMDLLYEINYKSIVLLMQSIVKAKKLNKGSSVVFVSSIAGLYGMKGNGMYAGTKGALISVSKVFANELAAQKIRVNCVAPGMVKTQITQETINQLSAEVIAEDEAKYPLGYGEPEDVANPICFLLSEASKWITGQTLTLDGGRTAII